MSLEYEKGNIPYARELRRNLTRQERRLWYDFLRHVAPRFQRQKAIGTFIVDFYCHAARLVVELDGGQHFEPAGLEKDRVRTAELNLRGLSVLRFSNLDVDQRFEAVCEAIEQAVKASLREGGAPAGGGGSRRAESDRSLPGGDL